MSDDESCCSAPSLVNSDNDNLVSESGYVVVRGCSTMTTWSVSDVFIVSRADDGDSDPPWRLFAACEWASFAHRLLLRQELRDKHYMTHKGQDVFKQYKLLHYARHLRALAKGEHPLSTIDRFDFYLNGAFR